MQQLRHGDSLLCRTLAFLHIHKTIQFILATVSPGFIPVFICARCFWTIFASGPSVGCRSSSGICSAESSSVALCFWSWNLWLLRSLIGIAWVLDTVSCCGTSMCHAYGLHLLGHREICHQPHTCLLSGWGGAPNSWHYSCAPTQHLMSWLVDCSICVVCVSSGRWKKSAE